MRRDTVVVVGSGLMGSGIACRAALAGNPVIMVDTELSRAEHGREKACQCVDELQKGQLCSIRRVYPVAHSWKQNWSMHAWS